MSNSFIVGVLKFGSCTFSFFCNSSERAMIKFNFRTMICEVRSVKSTVYHNFSSDHRPITWYNHVYMVQHTRLFFYIVKTKLEFMWTLSYVSGFSGAGHVDMSVPFLLRTK